MEAIKKYTAVILDDDPASIHMLEQCLLSFDFIEIIGRYSDPIDFMAFFNDTEYIDYLFLDIHMTISGLDVARMVRNKVRFIVFVTGYREFAVEAFADGDAYLVKPVQQEILLRAFNQLNAKESRKKRSDAW